MEPPRRPNQVPERQKQETANIVDDTTLLSFVAVLYAFVHYFSLMNLPQCTC